MGDDRDDEDDEDDGDDEKDEDQADEDKNQDKHVKQNYSKDYENEKNLNFDIIKDVSLEYMDKEEVDFYNNVAISHEDLNKITLSSKIIDLNNDDLLNIEKTIEKNEKKGFSK